MATLGFNRGRSGSRSRTSETSDNIFSNGLEKSPIRSIALCVLCGLPASGKSTFCRNFTERCRSNNLQTAFLAVDYDRIIPEHWGWPEDLDLNLAENTRGILTKDPRNVKPEEVEENKSWKSFRHQILMVVEGLVQNIKLFGKDGLRNLTQPEGVTSNIWKGILPCILSLDSDWQDAQDQLVIIIDDNMYFRSMRHECFKLARKYGTGFCQVFFNISTEEATKRNRKRLKEHQVPETVILRMAKKLEPPDPENIAWEHSTLAVEAENNVDLYQAVFDFLMSALSNPVQPLLCRDEDEVSQSQVQCSASLLHQGDLILRKCVAAHMAKGKLSGSSQDLQTRAKRAQRAKEVLLAKLRGDPFLLGVCSDWTIQLTSDDPSSDYFKFISEAFIQEISKLPS